MTPTTILNSTVIVPTSQESNFLNNFPTTTTLPPRIYDTPDVISLSARAIIGTLLGAGFLFGVFGNVLVLFAICLDKTLRRIKGNLMILSLAVTDLLMVSLPMPVLGVHFVLHWPQWNFGETMCRITVYVTSVSGFVSVFTMLFIAIDRYFAIVRNKIMLKRRNIKLALCSLWLISAVTLVHPRFINSGISEHSFKHGDWKVCSRLDSKVIVAKSSFRNSLIISVVLGVLIQLVSLLIYARVGFFLWRARKGPMGQDMETRITNKKVRALKLMFAIILAYFICWLPYEVATYLRLFPVPTNNEYIDPTYALMANSLAMLNSSINPLLYALFSEKFRAAYREIFGRTRRTTSRLNTVSSQQDTNHNQPNSKHSSQV